MHHKVLIIIKMHKLAKAEGAWAATSKTGPDIKPIFMLDTKPVEPVPFLKNKD